MVESRDIATLFSDAYSRSAPRVLGDQHKFLLDALESHLSTKKDPTLLVIGPGGQVLPYSCTYTPDGKLGESNRQRIKSMIGNGRMILLDYVTDFDKGGLMRGCHTLFHCGFFEPGYFGIGAFLPNIGVPHWDQDSDCDYVYSKYHLDPNNLPQNSISFLQNNLRDNFRIMGSKPSLDAIDATLSIHHASITKAELENLYKNLFYRLKGGGMLHLGEGNVDMNYTEEKLVRMCTDLSAAAGSHIILIDGRELTSGFVKNYFFEHGKQFSNGSMPKNDVLFTYWFDQPNPEQLEGIAEAFLSKEVPPSFILCQEAGNWFKGYSDTDFGKRYCMVVIDPKGSASLLLPPGSSSMNEQVAQELFRRGYNPELAGERRIDMPLIDPRIPEDAAGHIAPVNGYYDAISERVRRGYAGVDDELVEKITKGIEFERGNALKGIVEYYVGEGKILDALREAGFVDVNSVHHETEPFYNITARKPE